MAGKQRLLAVLRGEIPDRLPFVPLVNEYTWSTFPSEWGVDDPVSCCRRIGADIAERWVPSYVGYGFGPERIEHLTDARVRREESSVDGLIHISFHTPVGTLMEERRETSEAPGTQFRRSHLVKNVEDLRPYLYLWESMDPQPAYHLAQEHIDTIGDDGLAMVLTPCTPILHLIMYDLGLQALAYFVADYPQRMDRLFEVMTEKVLAAARLAARSPGEVGIVPENSGTRLVSPRQFDRYCGPVLAEFARAFHDEGKPLLLHACGHLRGLLHQIADTGLDGIESLTPPPTADVDLAYARQVLGPDRTIIGGLDPVWFVRATPEQVEERVIEIIEEVRPGRHFMLMPGDSTPAGVPMANYDAVRRAIDAHGHWL